MTIFLSLACFLKLDSSGLLLSSLLVHFHLVYFGGRNYKYLKYLGDIWEDFMRRLTTRWWLNVDDAFAQDWLDILTPRKTNSLAEGWCARWNLEDGEGPDNDTRSLDNYLVDRKSYWSHEVHLITIVRDPFGGKLPCLRGQPARPIIAFRTWNDKIEFLGRGWRLDSKYLCGSFRVGQGRCFPQGNQERTCIWGLPFSVHVRLHETKGKWTEVSKRVSPRVQAVLCNQQEPVAEGRTPPGRIIASLHWSQIVEKCSQWMPSVSYNLTDQYLAEDDNNEISPTKLP